MQGRHHEGPHIVSTYGSASGVVIETAPATPLRATFRLTHDFYGLPAWAFWFMCLLAGGGLALVLRLGIALRA